MAELREALTAAVEQAETDAAISPTDTVPEVQNETLPASEPSTEPSTVESEAPSESDQPTTTEESATPAEDAARQVQEKPTPQEMEQTAARHRVDRAPASWKREAKGVWNELPLHVRQEVHRREQQVNQVLAETAQTRETLQQFEQLVTPFVPRMQQLGVAPEQFIHGLLASEQALATGSREQVAGYIAKLVQDYNVDVNLLDQALSQQMKGRQQPQQPDIQQLVSQQVQQALMPLYQQQQAARQAEEQEVQQQAVASVNEMALDPRYPHFEDVRGDMADIIDIKARQGIYISLNDAYNMAISMNSEIQQQQSAQAMHQNAQRAKLAASSVGGAPATTGSQTFTGDGSLRGAIEAAFNGGRL